ncbi:MAG TPA: PAS domain S-box protein [Mycobacteriales bacterium]|nr:PAS domain S-box protein [Mycobacteriales bacterium]
MVVTEPVERRSSATRVPVAALVAATAEIAAGLDSLGRIDVVSDALAATYGYRSGELVGRRFTVLVHPDEAARVAAAIHAAAEGEPQQLLHRLRDTSGSYRWVESMVQWFRSTGAPVLLLARDVQGRVSHEQTLLRQVAAADDVFNELREGVVVIDTDGLVLAVNEAAATFLGVARRELLGHLARAHVTVVDEDGAPMPPERMPSTRAFRTGVAQNEAVQYRRNDGSSVWLFARTVPLFDPGQMSPARVAIFLEDLAATEGPEALRTRTIAAAAQCELTSREHEVLQLLAQGDDVRVISQRLGITVHTVRGHVKQVMQKLDARTQLQAVVVALRSGLVRLH